ncbi:MAG: hypothetical protein ACK5LT_00155 [Lachnospirales bacterium]
MKKMKIALIGAGSVSFAIGALHDIILSERLQNNVHLDIMLMDIEEVNLNRTYTYAIEMFKDFKSNNTLGKTLNLELAITKADFVITAIEVKRYHYWAQDFHIPRLYGSKQIYGENGGPGSMFHTLRNLSPMLEIAKTMEKCCPDAWLLNYTNPEAKLVEAICKYTKIKVVGLCHGLQMGINQVSEFLEINKDDIEVEGGGLNHFGWFTKIYNKKTGEDLYPLFKKKEKEACTLAQFDHYGLSRAMFNLYGMYPYPGTNHCGEYVGYSDDFYCGLSLLYRYNPLEDTPYKSKNGNDLQFVYNASGNHLDKGLFDHRKGEFNEEIAQDMWNEESYIYNKEKVKCSGEYAIPIIESIFFKEKYHLKAVNMQNKGAIKGLPDDMVVETQGVVDGDGIHLIPMSVELPTAVIGMINIQGSIHKLILEAYEESSKNKLLQAILLDPQAPTYYQGAAMIDHMCQLQKDILPALEWK